MAGPQVAGKALPTAESLRSAAERGFECVELHCPASALADVDETAGTIRDGPVAVASIHTPHVTVDDLGPIEDADRLARTLDATLVVHSQYLQHTRIPDVEALDLTADRGYENNPGASVRHLEATVLDAGHDLVVDTAHLYMAHEHYVDRLRTLLDRYGRRVPVVHLTDSSPRVDGLPFGDGDVDLPALGRLLKRSFDGTVVLEVMPEHQRAALEQFRTY